jgi:lysophospholipase L1-like esterase
VRPYLTQVSVREPAARCTIVTFGDSITDGFSGLSPSMRGWPGRLAERLALLAPERRCGVVNMGIQGNRLLSQGNGSPGLDRFWRDVASVPGATHVVLLEGINDIGAAGANAPEIINGYRQFITRARALGLRVIAGTLTPAGGSGLISGTPAKDAARNQVNTFIRQGGAFDGVIDFDAAVLNPYAPAWLRPEFDSGDHLHPNDAGYSRMGDAVDLNMFAPTR